MALSPNGSRKVDQKVGDQSSCDELPTSGRLPDRLRHIRPSSSALPVGAAIVALLGGLALYRLPGGAKEDQDRSGALDLASVHADQNAKALTLTKLFALKNGVGGWINSDGPLAEEDLKGRVVVVDFWASWCKPCLKELPNLNRLAGEYSTSEVVVVALTSDPATRTWGPLYRLGLVREGTNIIIGTQAAACFDAAGVKALPHTVIFNADGRMAFSRTAASAEELSSAVKKLRTKIPPDLKTTARPIHIRAGKGFGEARELCLSEAGLTNAGSTHTRGELSVAIADIRTRLKEGPDRVTSDDWAKLFDYYWQNLPGKKTSGALSEAVSGEQVRLYATTQLPALYVETSSAAHRNVVIGELERRIMSGDRSPQVRCALIRAAFGIYFTMPEAGGMKLGADLIRRGFLERGVEKDPRVLFEAEFYCAQLQSGKQIVNTPPKTDLSKLHTEIIAELDANQPSLQALLYGTRLKDKNKWSKYGGDGSEIFNAYRAVSDIKSEGERSLALIILADEARYLAEEHSYVTSTEAREVTAKCLAEAYLECAFGSGCDPYLEYWILDALTALDLTVLGQQEREVLSKRSKHLRSVEEKAPEILQWLRFRMQLQCGDLSAQPPGY
ncbi:MAG: hypothetical protein DCC75_04105 [Proteobacteria bacterium]|nr:MAG: hypothetical protein DCC75_04105 [Pseudomonadota bacterium]